MIKRVVLGIIFVLPSFSIAEIFNPHAPRVLLECHSESEGIHLKIVQSVSGLLATVTFATKRSFDFPVRLNSSVGTRGLRAFEGIKNATDEEIAYHE